MMGTGKYYPLVLFSRIGLEPLKLEVQQHNMTSYLLRDREGEQNCVCFFVDQVLAGCSG